MYKFIALLVLFIPSITFGQGYGNEELLFDFNHYQAEETPYQHPEPVPDIAKPRIQQPIQVVVEKQPTHVVVQQFAQLVVEEQSVQIATKDDICPCAEKTVELHTPSITSQILVSQELTDNFYDWQLWEILRIALLILSIVLPAFALLLRVFYGTVTIMTA